VTRNYAQKVAVTLCCLAGGLYLDICVGFGIPASIFYKDNIALWPTIRAIRDVIYLGFDLNNKDDLMLVS
jgi:hypothetical protein